MNAAFYTAISGMVATQKNMDVIGNNLANVNTVGFKGQRSSFSDALYSEMGTHEEQDFLQGHGTKNEYTDLVFKQGTMVMTQMGTDFAINGEGFFAVNKDGQRMYTRDGSFTIGMQGKTPYLVTRDGGYVLDKKGAKIKLDRIEDSNIVDQSNIKGKLGIYTFSNPYGLNPASNNCYLETDLSGKATTRAKGEEFQHQILQGTLENSTVDTAEEMVSVLQTQRAFQFNAKMLKTSDEVEEIVNNLR